MKTFSDYFRIALLLFCGSVFFSAALSHAADRVPGSKGLEQGDACFEKGDYVGALDCYTGASDKNPNSYAVLWRLARLYVRQGVLAEKKREKKALWEKAEECARQATLVNPDGADGHLYLAIALGKNALYSSADKKVQSAWEIKESAEKAVRLRPDEGKAYLTLGVWHRNVATASSFERQFAKIFFQELPEGNLREAERLLRKAIERNGEDIRHYYELGLTLHELGEHDRARSAFGKAMAMEAKDSQDKELKEDIEKLLRKSPYKE